MNIYGDYFYGNKISDYGLENGFVDFATACFGSCGKTIDVKFKHHSETDSFPESSLNMLKGDKAVEWITDAETGEILFCRE